MGFCSIQFVFLVLPGLLALWWIVPGRLRPLVLTAYSFGWYVQAAGWRYALLMGGVLLCDWALAGMVSKTVDKRQKQFCILVSVGKNVGLGVFFTLASQTVPFPMGLPVYGLAGMWYVINAARGYVVWEKNALHMLSCASFFPSLYAGPPIDAARHGPRITIITPTWEGMADGGGQFIAGLAKKTVLGDLLRALAVSLSAVEMAQMTWLDVFLLLLSSMLAMYFTLSGYWDMTAGIACMLGFPIGENANEPFLSKGINDFFGRFNIVVNRIIRRNVYVTLGGSKAKGLLFVRNVLLASLCMGLWYGFTLNYAIWGLLLGCFVVLERHFLRSATYIAGGVFHWTYAMVALMTSFCFFIASTPQQGLAYLRVLFGGGGGFYGDGTLYLLMSNLVLLLFSLLCICGIPRRIKRFCTEKLPVFYELYSTVSSLVLLGLSAAYLLL